MNNISIDYSIPHFLRIAIGKFIIFVNFFLRIKINKYFKKCFILRFKSVIILMYVPMRR